jgi:hypothetical protein
VSDLGTIAAPTPGPERVPGNGGEGKEGRQREGRRSKSACLREVLEGTVSRKWPECSFTTVMVTLSVPRCNHFINFSRSSRLIGTAKQGLPSPLLPTRDGD